jgi:hypothetical protein
MSSQQLTSSQEATDESELDFIALLSSVGDDEMSAEQTNVIETSVEGQVTDMTDVMSLVLPNHPGKLVLSFRYRFPLLYAIDRDLKYWFACNEFTYIETIGIL